MNGSVDNVTTELGGRITFRCNDGFIPSEVMTAECQTTGWSQDPALLECSPQGTLHLFLLTLSTHEQKGYCCWSVCLSVKSNLIFGASVHPENTLTYSAGNGGQNIFVGFSLKTLHCRDPALLH